MEKPDGVVVNPELKRICPINIEWTFPSYHDEFDFFEGNLRTPYIKAHNIEGLCYYLKFFLNKARKTCVVFKYRSTVHKEIAVKMEISVGKFHAFHASVEETRKKKFKELIMKDRPIKYCFEICDSKEFNNDKVQYLDKDQLVTIKAEGYIAIMDPTLMRHLDWRFNTGMRCYHGRWFDDDSKDIKINTEDGCIMAHKRILAFRTEFFNQQFAFAIEDDVHEISMFDTLESIALIGIKLCYDYKLFQEPMDFNTKILLLYFLDRYPIQKFKEELEDHLISMIDYNQVSVLSSAAVKAHCPKLEEACFQFLRKCVKEGTAIGKLEKCNTDFNRAVIESLYWHESETL